MDIPIKPRIGIASMSRITLSAIDAEGLRAQAKHGRDKTPFNPQMDRNKKLAILVEEVGEVAHELCEMELGNVTDNQNLVAELIQVATMAAAWAESEDHVREGS